MKAQMFNYNTWITLTDPFKLREHFNELLERSGFKVLSFVEYTFEPQGYTALWLLSESHFAVHTFPEEGKTYIELSSCIEEPFKRFVNREKTESDGQ